MSLPAISRHHKVLERAALIARCRSAQRRPCRLETDRLKDVDSWLQTYHRFWADCFDRLDLCFTDLQTNRGNDGHC
jgi:hypothetical protein